VLVFCDGDFWHGRNFDQRRERLARGNNADYWIAKIEGNIVRDARQNRLLRQSGWRIVRRGAEGAATVDRLSAPTIV
jgi:DNA mismatch endonuclease (patch repair protein)